MLKEQFERSGSWLFRYRSYMPLVVIALALPAAASTHALDARLDHLWELVCLSVSFFGLGIRAHAIGYAHKGTSGRNVTRQKAEVLNTTGLYSVVRNPLYLGNYIIWLGLSMSLRLWWFSLIVSLIFWVYYERIIFAEEAFLRAKFGDQFLEWTRKTPAFIPRLKNWKPPVQPFSLRTVLKREQSGLLAITTTFTFFEVLQDYIWFANLEFETMWVVIFFSSLAIFLTLSGLKKARLL